MTRTISAISLAILAGGCVEPASAVLQPTLRAESAAPYMLAPPVEAPDATEKAHKEAAKKAPPGKLQARPRDAKGVVAGAPPPPAAAALGGSSRIYTLDADFDEGAYSNVVHKVPDQLQLDDTTTPFNFIWVAVSSKGTIVKINTETGQVLGEYRTSP